jgi:glycosyltransferase involved in cell wall biosynthesis
MTEPLVSIIIPAYNCERFLGETIKCAVEQTYKNTEVIVVDDGSTDSTAEIAKSYENVNYIYQSNQGVAAARNTALMASKGEFIAFLDSDDIWPEFKVEKQLKFMIDNPEYGFTYTLHRCFLDDCIKEAPLWVRPEYFTEDEPGYIPSALLVRRYVFDIVGMFNTSYKVSEDAEWLLRAKDCGIKKTIVPELLLYKRVHDSNLTGRPDVQRELFRALSDSIIRKKGGNPNGHKD